MNKNKLLGGFCAVNMLVLPQIVVKAQQSTAVNDKKTNIIFILADDMGYCDLACYGNKYIETPNIDKLAATGTSFTQCYAGSGISSPSRCALMTGRNTGNTTIRDNFCNAGGIEGMKGTKPIRRMHLLPNDTTIATVLSSAGVWYDDETWDMNTKRYAALITHMDRAIGRLLAELDRLGLRENTMIIFASDNGAAKQAPLAELGCKGSLKGMKGQLYEGGIRVPFIVNQPGKVPVQKLNNIIYFPDVMPTLAALANATDKLPQNLNGINVLPLFYGKQMDTDNRLLYWEFPGKQRAARRGDWKVVTIKKDAPLELYNIKEDMTESMNLADKYPGVIAEFEKEMEKMHVPTPNWPLPGEF